MTAGWLPAQWPAPANVRAGVSLRHGGASRGPWSSLNLATHVDDEPAAVEENRRRLRMRLSLPDEPEWLTQVHGSRVVDLDGGGGAREADGARTATRGRVCAVLTADCLPVVLCDRAGRQVAVAHAGWRGLAGGVLEAAVDSLSCEGDDVLAWLGPAIAAPRFEVGAEVRAAFLGADASAADAFTANARGRWQADLYRLARLRLAAAGVRSVHGGGRCTFEEQAAFFSHRRDGRCGRMATLAWLV